MKLEQLVFKIILHKNISWGSVDRSWNCKNKLVLGLFHNSCLKNYVGKTISIRLAGSRLTKFYELQPNIYRCFICTEILGYQEIDTEKIWKLWKAWQRLNNDF